MIGNYVKNFKKIAKYREPHNVEFKQAMEEVISGVNHCVVACYQRKGVASAIPQQRKIKVSQLIDERTATLKGILSNFSENNVFQKTIMLSIHQNKFKISLLLQLWIKLIAMLY